MSTSRNRNEPLSVRLLGRGLNVGLAQQRNVTRSHVSKPVPFPGCLRLSTVKGALNHHERNSICRHAIKRPQERGTPPSLFKTYNIPGNPHHTSMTTLSSVRFSHRVDVTVSLIIPRHSFPNVTTRLKRS